MTPAPGSDWKRMEEIFLAAADLPATEQKAFLDSECGDDSELRRQVEALLSADKSAPTRISAAVAEAAEALNLENAHEEVGRRIGPYVIAREIGSGGMGTVYQAVRADGEFFQVVAIKLIKPGLASGELLRRFRLERHILARLDHPAIARLLDGGTTEGNRPYLVMDFIDGSPIDRYSTEHKLDVTGRLRLFLQVCDGVAYAHKNQIVHRDLKPGNILVNKNGQAKLLDFGIAKWLTPDMAPETVVETIPGMTMLTPDYASPEQVQGGEITERTDIYALGAILFELLTGQRAQKITSHAPGEIARVVCDTDTRRPSDAVAGQTGEAARLRKDLRRGLDRIVLGAMHKNPSGRYQTVDALAADIRNFLEGNPIHPPGSGAAYRYGRLLRRHWLALAAVLLITIGLALAWKFRLGRQAGNESVDSIAVLPVVNLGVQSSEDVLADGLTEDLITELANSPGLRVPSRTAVWQYRGKAFDIREAGRALGVTAVLEGSIRRSGNELRITAQLISVRDGFHLWAQNYDRSTGGGMLAIQQQVSRGIATDIRNRLAGKNAWNQTGRAMPNSEAQALYLEGHRLFHQDSIQADWTNSIPPRLQAAITAFEQATQKDPNFSAAWASLAEVSEWAVGFDQRQGAALRAKAESSALRALELEPTNALALATLGLVYWQRDWNFRKAEPYLRRAVEISPRTTGMQIDLSQFLLDTGRPEQAIELLERAQFLDPSAATLPARLAVTHLELGNCPLARKFAERALSLSPGLRHAVWAVAMCDARDGNLEKAETAFRSLIKLGSNEHRSVAALSYLLARSGDPARMAEARALSRTLDQVVEKGRRREVFAAVARTGLGDYAGAMQMLERAWERRDPNLLVIHSDPRFQPLASDPKFQALRSRIIALR